MRKLVLLFACAFLCGFAALAERVNVGGVWVEMPGAPAAGEGEGGGSGGSGELPALPGGGSEEGEPDAGAEDPSAPAPVPDVKVKTNAVYARRGSLGANDYVVTNVAPCASAYLMNEVKAGKLRDRAVNVVTVSEAEAAFELPLKRTVEGYARAMLVAVTAECATRITLTGAESLWGTFPKKETLELCAGTHVLQIIEIGKAVYLVEAREIVEFKEE